MEKASSNLIVVLLLFLVSNTLGYFGLDDELVVRHEFGEVSDRIVEGEKAAKHSIPWQVQLLKCQNVNEFEYSLMKQILNWKSEKKSSKVFIVTKDPGNIDNGVKEYKICRRGCGGTIIDEYHILTAAHCVVTKCQQNSDPATSTTNYTTGLLQAFQSYTKTPMSAENLMIAVGEHDTTDWKVQKSHRVHKVHVHSKFNPQSMINTSILTLVYRS